MRSRSETTLRAGALTLFAALVLAELGTIALASGLNDQPQLSYPYQRDVSEQVGLMASAVVGLLVTWARPRNPIGWLISLTGSCLALCNLLQTYGARSVVFADEDLPFGTAAMSLGAPLWIPAVAIPVTLMLVRYPTGVIAGKWARRFDRLVVFGYLPMYVGYAASPTSVTDVVRGRLPPWHVPVPVADGLAMLGALAMITGLMGIVVDAIRRVIRSDQRERMALIWVTLATVLAAVTIFFGPVSGSVRSPL